MMSQQTFHSPPLVAPSEPPAVTLLLLFLVASLMVAPLVRAQNGVAEPVRLSARVLGANAEIEARDLPRDDAEKAIRAALAEAYEIERLLADDGEMEGGLATLDDPSGRQTLDPRLAELLLGGLRYCLWSSGAHGPLGGAVYDQWAAAGDHATPHPLDLRAAVATAECDRLAISGNSNHPETLRFALATGTRILPVASARGFAVDRAMAILLEHGVSNAWVEIGPVVRALGPGPEGEGWLLALPTAPGEQEPLDEVWLRDMALAVLDDGPIYEGTVSLIDLRTGVPAQGVTMVAVATAAAFDAEILAASLIATGMRDGLRRLGSLSPRPAVYWLLGQGVGAPLESTYRWSDLPRLKRRRD